jgi:class 3 adenylate cyclase
VSEQATPIQRRLAAILAADVAGYSRLMGVDEVGTLNALKAIRRDLADPAISARHGRVVKTTGDGILVNNALFGRGGSRSWLAVMADDRWLIEDDRLQRGAVVPHCVLAKRS